MATKKRNQSEEDKAPPELMLSKNEARSKIEERMEKGRELRNTQVTTADGLDSLKNLYDKWNKFNGELLRRIFSTDELAKEYLRWRSSVTSLEMPSLGEKISDLYEDIDDKIHRLDSISERLELIPLSISTESGVIAPNATSRSVSKSKKVFVVHGHDERSKTALEVFLREIGLEPIVLHRQADEGLTVIEKFEKHSDVGYVFILLTPDEIAYLADQEKVPDAERIKEKRARPNVIFEFGYFVGKLGRSKVCCLYTGEVTLPSDISGMIYKKYSSSIEEIAYGIMKDLKAQGYEVT